jgi:hypothetical protein
MAMIALLCLYILPENAKAVPGIVPEEPENFEPESSGY